MTDRVRLEKASKLLAKAASTDSSHEARALVDHAYRMLAELAAQHGPLDTQAASRPVRNEAPPEFSRIDLYV
jgi:hypothetical protein